MRISLELHKIAKRDGFHVYKLPYRVYYDYLRKRANEPSDKLMLNPCYPDPGYPIEGILKVSKDDFIISKEDMATKKGADLYCYENLNPECQEIVNRIKKRWSPWERLEALFSAEWEQTFLHLLNGYDFNSFSCFDFFGGSLTEANDQYDCVTTAEIEIMRHIYTRHKEKYLENPEKYKPNEPLNREEYSYLFYDEPFVLKLTPDEAKAKLEMYHSMNMLMSEVESEAFCRLHGVDYESLT